MIARERQRGALKTFAFTPVPRGLYCGLLRTSDAWQGAEGQRAQLKRRRPQLSIERECGASGRGMQD